MELLWFVDRSAVVRLAHRRPGSCLQLALIACCWPVVFQMHLLESAGLRCLLLDWYYHWGADLMWPHSVSEMTMRLVEQGALSVYLAIGAPQTFTSNGVSRRGT